MTTSQDEAGGTVRSTTMARFRTEKRIWPIIDPRRFTRNLVLSSARGTPEHFFCLIGVELASAVVAHPLGDVVDAGGHHYCCNVDVFNGEEEQNPKTFGSIIIGQPMSTRRL